MTSRIIADDPVSAEPGPRAEPERASEPGPEHERTKVRQTASLLRAPAACLGLAVASLPLPATLSYDPWAWLVWGREVANLELDTTGGPSWKPLPVVVTTVLSAFGDHAETLWLVAVRTVGLLTLVAAFRLAARFAGPAAGLLAAGFLVLTPDSGPRFLRLVTEGHGAPLSAAVTLWAVERHLDGRHDHALLLAAGLALLRPEAWPFLVAYAAWFCWREPARWRFVLPFLLVVPVLWFGGDWWGSGDPWHGADAAQVASGDVLDRLGLGLRRVANLVAIPAWVAAGAAVVTARRRDDRLLPRLGAAATAWCMVVVAMAVAFGYAALSRFLLPGAALLCVLAGVGAVRIVVALRRRLGGPVGATAAWVVALVALASVAPRVVAMNTLVDETEARAELGQGLDQAVAQAGGAEAVLACGRVAIDPLVVPRMAWKLDVPLGRVERELEARAAGVVFARVGGDLDEEVAAEEPSRVAVLARSESWMVYTVDCPAAEQFPSNPGDTR